MNISTNDESSTGDRMDSYKVAASISKGRMARENPLSAAALEAVEASDIVVVRDIYDHVEQVLEALDVPFQAVAIDQFEQVALQPEQLLIINCPGCISSRDVEKVRSFVESGGTLFTTDWALRNVIEPAFPGVLEYNEHATADDVVRIEIVDSNSPYLAGVLETGDDPQWWLEGSSYPIRILDSEKVKVLIKSKELGNKYGEDPVAVVFPQGKGEVFHMISHYYLQRTEFRSDRHHMEASVLAAEKNISLDDETTAFMAGLKLGDVESAESSTRFIANIVADKKRKQSQS